MTDVFVDEFNMNELLHSKFCSGNRNSFMEFHGWFQNFRIFKNRLIFGDFGGTKISQKFSGIQNNLNFPSYSNFYGHVKFSKFHVCTILIIHTWTRVTWLTWVCQRTYQVSLLGVCNESVRMAGVKFLTKNNYFRSKLRNSKNNTNSKWILKWTFSIRHLAIFNFLVVD